LGFSLVELMVALAAGLVVSGAVLSFFLSSMKSNGEMVQSTRLTQELRNTLDLVSRDLRRAGYDQDALKHLATGTASPFPKLLLPVASQVSAGPPATYSCVVYAYDRADTGVCSSPTAQPGVVDVCNGEVRAIRFRTRTVGGRPIGVIEYAESSGAVKPACTDAAPTYTSKPYACVGTWCPLSDPSVVDITSFTLGDNRTVVGGAAGERMQIRDLDLRIVGRLSGTTDFTREARGSVRVRSDCFDPAATGSDPTNFGVCTQTP
jgi:type II secretory pathway pseudopilin PulG